jgi:hypothetical protein
MRDSDQEYPKHQPGRSGNAHHDPFAPDVQEGEIEEPRRRPVHQRESATTPELPPGHARNSVIIGAIIGVLVALQGIILTVKNADAYKEAAKYINDANKMPMGVATTVFGITVLSLAISALFYFIGGLIIGRVAVHRRWAFIGGFAGGVVNWVIGAFLKLIPAYPDAGNTGFSGNMLGTGGGIVAAIIGIILLGLLAGVLSLFGAWLTTRRHPYYVGYSG